MEAIPAVIALGTAAYSAYSQNKQRKKLEQAQDEQRSVLAQQQANVDAVAAGQRANQGGRRGLLSFVELDEQAVNFKSGGDNTALKSRLGGA
jgi:hypothetical protein